MRDAEDKLSCYAIVVENNEVSESGFDYLTQSSLLVDNAFTINRFDAIDHTNVAKEFKSHFLTWTYPWEGKQTCIKSGLTKSAYPTVDRNKRVACFMSHYHLWKKCLKDNILLPFRSKTSIK